MRNFITNASALSFLAASASSAASCDDQTGCSNLARVIDRTIQAHQKKQIWIGADYDPYFHCVSAGAPIFTLTSKPKLGEMTSEQTSYVAKVHPCEGMSYTGTAIWYTAGSTRGTDVITYTLEFLHCCGNRVPSVPKLVTATIHVD
jgi:hypothetical protein